MCEKSCCRNKLIKFKKIHINYIQIIYLSNFIFHGNRRWKYIKNAIEFFRNITFNKKIVRYITCTKIYSNTLYVQFVSSKIYLLYTYHLICLYQSISTGEYDFMTQNIGGNKWH